MPDRGRNRRAAAGLAVFLLVAPIALAPSALAAEPSMVTGITMFQNIPSADPAYRYRRSLRADCQIQRRLRQTSTINSDVQGGRGTRPIGTH